MSSRWPTDRVASHVPWPCRACLWLRTAALGPAGLLRAKVSEPVPLCSSPIACGPLRVFGRNSRPGMPPAVGSSMPARAVMAVLTERSLVLSSPRWFGVIEKIWARRVPRHTSSCPTAKVSLWWKTDTAGYIVGIYAQNISAALGPRLAQQPHLPCSPDATRAPVGRKLASRFLRISPCNGHPCVWLRATRAGRTWDFHPLGVCHARHAKRASQSGVFLHIRRVRQG